VDLQILREVFSDPFLLPNEQSFTKEINRKIVENK